MELKDFAVTMIILGLIIVIGGSILQVFVDDSSVEYLKTDNALMNSGTAAQLTYTPTDDGLTVQRYNQTWLNFTGGDTNVTIPHSTSYSINTTNSLTVGYWYLMPTYNFTGNNPTSQYDNVVSKVNYNPTRAEWHFRHENATGLDGTDPRPCRISFYVFNSSGGLGSGSAFQDNDTIASCPSQENKWIYVTGKVDPVNVWIYKNGMSRDKQALLKVPYGIIPQGTNATLIIGANDQGAGYGEYLGRIDDLQIFNRDLTHEEIAEKYYAGLNEHITTTPIYNDTYLTFTESGSGITDWSPSVLGNQTSYSGWFYRRNNATNDAILGGNNSFSTTIRLNSANNGIAIYPNISAGSASWNNAYLQNNWVHFVIVYNNTNGNATLYINGTAISTLTVSLPGRYVIDTTNFLTIGSRYGTPDYFNGSLDDIAIYNKSLNATEVASIYSAGRNNANPITSSRVLYYTFNNDGFVNFFDNVSQTYNGYLDGRSNLATGAVIISPTKTTNGSIIGYRTFIPTTTGLVGQWKLNENTGTTAYDTSGNANNGVINGATYVNDGVLVSVLSSSYTLLSKTFTLTDAALAYTYLTISYYSAEAVYNVAGDSINALDELTNWFSILIIISIAGIIIYFLLNSLGSREMGNAQAY